MKKKQPVVEYTRPFMPIAEFRKYAEENNIPITDEYFDVLRGLTFKTGEIVNVLNGYDVLYKGLQIKGFDLSPTKNRPNAIVYVYDDSYWFAIEISRIFKQ